MEILIGQIPEAIYFSLFMIFTKDLKEKRLLYTALMIIDYLLIMTFIKYNIWIQVLYTFTSFITLKVLYKEKAQITDVFTFTIASIILILISFLCGILYINHVFDYIACAVINRIILLIFVLAFRKKLPKIQTLYKKLWNRNDKVEKKIKSTTFRSINVVIFNMIFYIIHLGMIYAIYFNGK